MANTILDLHRQKYPGDPRSDDQIILDYAREFPEDTSRFPDFQSDLQRITKAQAPTGQQDIPPEFQRALASDFPPGIGDYAKQVVGSGIRGATSTISSIPE